MYEFYKEHSVFTDPAIYAEKLDQLPDTIPELVKVVQGLIIHRLDGQIFGINIPQDRLNEMEIRKVSSMLEVIFKLDDSPITQPRSVEKKLISGCRDFAVLLCAFLRHKGIPARPRVGFAHYVFGGTHDHILAEYWNEAEQRWVLVDSRIGPEYKMKVPRLKDMNLYDVKKPDFDFASDIWLTCRQGLSDPNKFGCGTVSKTIKGFRHIQDRMIHELAMLNKMEMLPWDLWGYMIWDLPGVAPHEPEHVSLLDELALALSDQFVSVEKLKTFYQHPMLKLSSPILCASQILGKHELQVSDVV
jgi:excinuclease ABC subunit A